MMWRDTVKRSHTQQELRQLHNRASDDDCNAKALGKRVFEAFSIGQVEVLDD
jgi:hypothetical protein